MTIIDLFWKKFGVVDYLESSPRETSKWNEIALNPRHDEEDPFWNKYDPSDLGHQSFALAHMLENLGHGDPSVGLNNLKKLNISPDVSVLGLAHGLTGQVYILSDNTVIKIAPAISEKYIKQIKELGIKSSMPEIYSTLDVSDEYWGDDIVIHMANAGETIDELFSKNKIGRGFINISNLIKKTIGDPEGKTRRKKFDLPTEINHIKRLISGDKLFGTEEARSYYKMNDEEREYATQLLNSVLNWEALGINITEDLHRENMTVDPYTNQINFIDFGYADTEDYNKLMTDIGGEEREPIKIGEALEAGGFDDGADQFSPSDEMSRRDDMELLIHNEIEFILRSYGVSDEEMRGWVDDKVNELLENYFNPGDFGGSYNNIMNAIDDQSVVGEFSQYAEYDG